MDGSAGHHWPEEEHLPKKPRVRNTDIHTYSTSTCTHIFSYASVSGQAGRHKFSSVFLMLLYEYKIITTCFNKYIPFTLGDDMRKISKTTLN